MSLVLSVKIGLVTPGMFDSSGGKIPGGKSEDPNKYFFGHSVPVTIKVEKKGDCRLIWAEKTNIPIIDEQSPSYFVDMYKIHPKANTFKKWNEAQGAATVTVTDIPSMVGGVGKTAAAIRWLEIIAIVQSNQNAKYAHFKQNLTFDPGKSFDKEPTTEEQVGSGPRKYNYEILKNDESVDNQSKFLAEVFNGTPRDYFD